MTNTVHAQSPKPDDSFGTALHVRRTKCALTTTNHIGLHGSRLCIILLEYSIYTVLRLLFRMRSKIKTKQARYKACLHVVNLHYTRRLPKYTTRIVFQAYFVRCAFILPV